MFRLTVLACVLCAVSGKSITSEDLSTGRIIHGETITIETAPHQVSIIRTATDRHTCGGSIVSRHYVLTAGHCAGGAAEDYKVRSGSSFWSRGGSVHRVVQVIRHKDYHATEAGSPVHDVALMRVEEPFDVDGKTRKFTVLFESREASKAGRAAVVTGWGKKLSISKATLMMQNV